MDGPNGNAVLIALFGTVNAVVAALVAIMSIKNSHAIRYNTDQTVKAKNAARIAAQQTNGGLEPLVKSIVEKLLAEHSATTIERMLTATEKGSTEHTAAK